MSQPDTLNSEMIRITETLGGEVNRLAAALGAESERLTVALGALHKLLELKPPGVEAMELYFAMRDIAREGILGKA